MSSSLICVLSAMMRQVGAAGKRRLAQRLDQAGKLLNRGAREAIADPAVGRAGVAPRAPSDRALRRRGEQTIDLIDDLAESGRCPVARPCQRVRNVGADAAGVGAEHDDAVGHFHRFLDIVRDQDDALGRYSPLDPQILQVAAQRFGGQDVERGERLVEQQDIGIDHERAGEADALAHAARQFLGIG